MVIPCTRIRIGRSFAPRLVCATFLVAVGSQAPAEPLKWADFSALSKACATGIDPKTIAAVASVESHFEPLAIRDNTAHESRVPVSLPMAVAFTEDRLKRGDSLDLGIMQINSRNLATLGLSVPEAFDPCHSIDAAQRILLGASVTGTSETERQAAILITLSRYNTGKPLAGIANGYAHQVIVAQNNVPPNTRTGPTTSPQWQVWGAAITGTSAWFRALNEQVVFDGAGAQSTDARNEGRASASPLEKGEPYELLAFKENEASHR